MTVNWAALLDSSGIKRASDDGGYPPQCPMVDAVKLMVPALKMLPDLTV
jgi:hypothetical protein